MTHPAANVDDARGLAFACLPECGFCCTASPLVAPHERHPLAAAVVTAPDGTLRIPLRGAACGSLRTDRRCGVYEVRPAVCRVYPYQVHAGRRLQAVVSLACPGVVDRHTPHAHVDAALHPAADTEDMTQGARDVVAMVLGMPGAAEQAARAKETFAEFDRRMKEWGVATTPDRLRSAFLPHVERLADPGALSAYFAGLGDGDLVLDGRPAAAVGALFEADADEGLDALLDEAARDAFGENEDALWVEPSLAWTVPRVRGDRVVLHRPGAADAEPLDAGSLPTAWDADASAVLARYLARLAHRDHAEGAAAWLVDASGYQVTPAAAYARVLGEAALQVALRAGLLAAEQGRADIDAPTARRGVAAYETSFHSLPTLGAIL